MATVDTLNVEVVLKPLSPVVIEYVAAVDDLADYIEDCPWCGLQHVLAAMQSRIEIKA